MLDVLRNRPSKMAFAEGDHAMETLFLDRAHEALRVGIRVGRLKRRLHHADPCLAEPFANGRAPLAISVTDQHAMVMCAPGTCVTGRVTIGVSRAEIGACVVNRAVIDAAGA